MDLTLTPEEERFRAELRSWLENNHPGPEPAGAEESIKFRRGWQQRMQEAREKKDLLAESAFKMLERERRAILPALAEAVDRMETAPPLEARFSAFVPTEARGGDGVGAGAAGQWTVLVAPVSAEMLETADSGDPRVHGACARVMSRRSALWRSALLVSTETVLVGRPTRRLYLVCQRRPLKSRTLSHRWVSTSTAVRPKQTRACSRGRSRRSFE